MVQVWTRKGRCATPQTPSSPSEGSPAAGDNLRLLPVSLCCPGPDKRLSLCNTQNKERLSRQEILEKSSPAPGASAEKDLGTSELSYRPQTSEQRRVSCLNCRWDGRRRSHRFQAGAGKMMGKEHSRRKLSSKTAWTLRSPLWPMKESKEALDWNQEETNCCLTNNSYATYSANSRVYNEQPFLTFACLLWVLVLVTLVQPLVLRRCRRSIRTFLFRLFF